MAFFENIKDAPVVLMFLELFASESGQIDQNLILAFLLDIKPQNFNFGADA